MGIGREEEEEEEEENPEPFSYSRRTPSPTPTPLRSGPGSRAASRRSQQPPQPEHEQQQQAQVTHQQQYLNSLQPPSPADFARLLKVQEDRVRERTRLRKDLRRREKVAAQKIREARREFMHDKAVLEEEEEEEEESRPREDGTKPKPEPEPDRGHLLRAKAATVIQRTYRGYRTRREMQGLGLDASTRWTHAIRDAQWKDLTTPRAPRAEGTAGAARQNWKKAAAIARRAGGDEDSGHDSPSSSGSSGSDDSAEWEHMSPEEREAVRRKRKRAQLKRRKHARLMGLQYFLEMVDLKHRHGSNLRTYHEEWKRSDTHENFFYWLDYGDGKHLDLPACPRERLDRERIRYLNREERQHYLVRVDDEGRLVWAKNGIRIDTTEEWKDSIHGIVPADDPTPAFSYEVESGNSSRGHEPPLSPSRESELEAAMAAKYTDPDLDNARGIRKLRHISATTVLNKLLRKSVRKNTWIFVADTSFRLYVGIKASGAFQHSSFLHGSRISAAGLIKVKNGRLSRLSPLSGHYRPPASNFRAFVHSLEDEGVDMSHVSISRSYAVLFGLEMYVKTRRKGKDLLAYTRGEKKKKKKKRDIHLFRHDESGTEDDDDNNSQSATEQESESLQKKKRKTEEREREENRASVRIMQKLGMRPRTPLGQQDGRSAAAAPGDDALTG